MVFRQSFLISIGREGVKLPGNLEVLYKRPEAREEKDIMKCMLLE